MLATASGPRDRRGQAREQRSRVPPSQNDEATSSSVREQQTSSTDARSKRTVRARVNRSFRQARPSGRLTFDARDVQPSTDARRPLRARPRPLPVDAAPPSLPAGTADERHVPIRMARRERARTPKRSPRWLGRCGCVRGRRGLQLTKIACSRLVPAARLSRSDISAKRLPFGLRIQNRARGDSVPTITSPAYLASEAAGAM